MRLRDAVDVPMELRGLVPNSFDVIGSREGAVVVVEIPSELEQYKYEIAKALIRLNKNVKSVVRRVGARRGAFRLYETEVLIPGPTEVMHRELGYRLLIDPTKVFFSPRDQSDRLDLSLMVGRNESIAYLFAGAGPYAFAILKRQPDVSSIHAVELNPDAVIYLERNVKLNKVRGKVIPIEDDARHFCNVVKQGFNRVIMTLPLGAGEYLIDALSCIAKGGIIHFYHTGREENPWSEAESIVLNKCIEANVNCNIIGRRIVREYAPYVYKIRMDIKIS
ncbi:methyltransferase [Thermocladium modestius]|uniref:Methyltransferase n=1 Tax=Thermocladium modestius TaxID=62609 RepID=A0A830GZW3_9CREN|nr:class I SAM-dependent methyltransferase family protein [Thermocladium modestius]GGP22547.1 methyltransferase [Thermocladium modestius]